METYTTRNQLRLGAADKKNIQVPFLYTRNNFHWWLSLFVRLTVSLAIVAKTMQTLS